MRASRATAAPRRAIVVRVGCEGRATMVRPAMHPLERQTTLFVRTAVQPTVLLVTAHRDEGLLDRGDGVLAFPVLTFSRHVCNHTIIVI